MMNEGTGLLSFILLGSSYADIVSVQQRRPRSPLIINTCHWITARLNP